MVYYRREIYGEGIMMTENVVEIISLLDGKDKKKVLDFANILIKRSKYNRLRKEIEHRRDEVKRGEVLLHEEIWQES